MTSKLIPFAGIGTRETTEEDLRRIRIVASFLHENNYICRTGRAEGSDAAFMEHCRSIIYLPWWSYNRHIGGKEILLTMNDPIREAFDIAKKFHPSWGTLKDPVRKLHARNTHIILGRNLDIPVKFVVCAAKEDHLSFVQGGTGQGVRVAQSYKIPVLNLRYRTAGEVISAIAKI